MNCLRRQHTPFRHLPPHSHDQNKAWLIKEKYSDCPEIQWRNIKYGPGRAQFVIIAHALTENNNQKCRPGIYNPRSHDQSSWLFKI